MYQTLKKQRGQRGSLALYLNTPFIDKIKQILYSQTNVYACSSKKSRNRNSRTTAQTSYHGKNPCKSTEAHFKGVPSSSEPIDPLPVAWLFITYRMPGNNPKLISPAMWVGSSNHTCNVMGAMKK